MICLNFQNRANHEKLCRIINTASIWQENILGYLFLGSICSSKLTVFLELCSRKSVRSSEHNVRGQFPRQGEAIVYLVPVRGTIGLIVAHWKFDVL